LGSVNPLAVLFQRKIWPPSVFPLFTLVFLAGWWHRHRGWGAFVWGLMGACLGQINMAGFFFAAGFVLWALLFERKAVAWWSWLGGSFLGTIPLIPWLPYLIRDPHLPGELVLRFKFWSNWVTEPFGLGLKYSLGKQFQDFLRYPLVDGQPSYFVMLLHVAVAVIGAVVIGRALWRMWQERWLWGDFVVGRRSSTGFTLSSAFWGYGLLFAASGLPFHRHYLIVTFPLMFVWVAWLALLPDREHQGQAAALGRCLLAALCILEGLLTLNFLYYIHLNHGAILGDYGLAYGALKGSAP
jgi:hypothetical protein